MNTENPTPTTDTDEQAAPPPEPIVSQQRPRFATLVVHLELTEQAANAFWTAQDNAGDEAMASVQEEPERVRAIDPALNAIAVATLCMEAAQDALERRQSLSDAIEDAQQAANQMDPTSGPIIEGDEHGNRVCVSLVYLPYSPFRKG